MAVTSISITQDNITNSCIALSINNPLTFIATVNYTGTALDYIYVTISDITDGTVQKGIYKARPLEDISETQRTYFIELRNILKSLMPDMDDYEQGTDLIEYCENIQCKFRLTFSADDESDSVDILAVNSYRQIGENPCIEDITDNVNDDMYTGAEDMPLYLYFYNDNENNVISLTQTSQLLPPTITPNNGDYYTGQQVTMSNTQGALMYYTVDGSIPTASSTLYTSPFALNTPTDIIYIKAICVKNGYPTSNVQTKTYKIIKDNFDENPISESFLDTHLITAYYYNVTDTDNELVFTTTSGGLDTPTCNIALTEPIYNNLKPGTQYNLDLTGIENISGYVTLKIELTGYGGFTTLLNTIVTGTSQNVSLSFNSNNGNAIRITSPFSDTGGSFKISGIELYEY